MAYESNGLSRHTARYESNNDDNAIVFQLIRGGVKITPASATITVYAPGNTTAVLGATAMTVSGSLMTYAIVTTDTDDYPVGNGYRAHIIVTVGSVTHEDDIYFDVAKNVPSGAIGVDQLVALDERISGMENSADADFSEVIQAAWSECQFDIETRQSDGKQLKDSMVVDRVRLSVVVRHLVLSMILRPKGLTEDAKYHEDKYQTKLGQLLTSLPHDVNQDQEEDSDITMAMTCRLVQ